MSTDRIAPSVRTDVFLGGACNPTTWRFDIAIPVLERAGVSFYNPQVEDWSPELEAIEAAAKDGAQTCLFVIDSQTRAIASMLEAAELIGLGRDVMLVVLDMADGTVIDGEAITGRQLKDLNRARAYLRGIADRAGTPACASVNTALTILVARYGTPETRGTYELVPDSA